MGTEIERKFLVDHALWQPEPASGTRYRQGYLASEPGNTVRVRIAGDQGYLTIKGATHGIERLEFEYPIPLEDARQLLSGFCRYPAVEKIRYREPWDGLTWEVDVFEGENAGLIVAEIELPTPDWPFTRPPWIGKEVSDDPRYFNAALSRQPFSRWNDTA